MKYKNNDSIFAPAFRKIFPVLKDDLVAQLVEHLPFKEVVLGSSPRGVTSPGAEIGRQAWLRAMCPLGRVGSIPILGTKVTLFRVAFFIGKIPYLDPNFTSITP